MNANTKARRVVNAAPKIPKRGMSTRFPPKFNAAAAIQTVPIIAVFFFNMTTCMSTWYAPRGSVPAATTE